ncbi:HypC/HybG/HupF family hydrogenase formation chaperone [Bradyrhizobium sp. CB3481]|uniref:HypC/HybG/HupF family hydrogenase formation chaperone n=1 Tax=Bradyrhizobium sp. CB3481 TaxID=3039158 RepID=UPI0024B0DB3B|nr:HypC/HybG/HupF family hydrogenase formation chaperone [Bradyrhizobium sp. CB3481]WFU14806.1 HypC/HybG/HupF family hydrogenase formation chaperone [Bradyrhizobium sp. CB3481]
MCLSIPAEVKKILPDHMAIVSIDGVGKEISTALIEDLAVGDYVLIHVGHALTKIDSAEARRTLELLQELSGERQELQS